MLLSSMAHIRSSQISLRGRGTGDSHTRVWVPGDATPPPRRVGVRRPTAKKIGREKGMEWNGSGQGLRWRVVLGELTLAGAGHTGAAAAR
jgi:hypothetical protein